MDDQLTFGEREKFRFEAVTPACSNLKFRTRSYGDSDKRRTAAMDRPALHHAFKNQYEDWPGYSERLLTRAEMIDALRECDLRWPSYEFRGHNVSTQQPGKDRLRLIR